MAELNFQQFIERERERLHKAREQITKQRDELQIELEKIDTELDAIEAYETAKTGKKAKTPRGSGKRQGGRREQVLTLLRDQALNRRDILSALKLKGEKSGEQSVSNALSALLKSKQLKRNNDGKYAALG